MKKFFALLLAGLMVFALVACTPTENPDNPDNPDVTENPDTLPYTPNIMSLFFILT